LLTLLLALTTAAPVRPDSTQPPADVVRQALRAVERDLASPLRARWSGLLRQDSTQRAALLGLATLARLTYDYDAADRLYPRLFRDAQPDGYAAYARLGRAWSLEERGRSEAAGEEFARARESARAARDRSAEAEALIGLAVPRAATGGMALGLALLDTAGSLIPRSDLVLQAERGWRRAIILGVLADPRATDEASASIALARRSGALRVEAQAYRSLAKVLDWRGREDSALAAFAESEERFHLARDRSWLAVTLMNRANTLRKRGDIVATLAALRAALGEGGASHNQWAVASAHTGLGVVALQLDDLETARSELSRAVAMFEAQGDRSSAMNARKFLAVIAQAAGDLPGARRLTLEALAFYRGTGETLDEFGLQQTLATLAMRERDWPAAERALADARTLLPRLEGPRWAALLDYDHGRLATARGDLASADRSFRRFLTTLDSTEHLARYDARLRLAEVYARRRDLGAAEREATVAWDELDGWRATLSDRDLRLLAFQLSPSENQASSSGLSEQRASVAWVLAALASGGRAAAGFDLAERRRARELRDRLVQARALRADSSAAGALPRQSSMSSAAELEALIPDPHTAVVEYVTGGLGAPTTAFVLARPGAGGAVVRAVILPPADTLAGPLARFLALAQRGGPQDVVTLVQGDGAPDVARDLSRAYLDSVTARLGDSVTRLIVVPDGPLHRMPWDLLRLADGRYLVQRYAVSVAPSAAILAELWRRGSERPPDGAVSLLAMGDPDIPKVPRLQGSGREARLVARYSPDAMVRLRREASGEWLRNAQLARYGVLHFATHAVVDERSAAGTHLMLAPAGQHDGQVGPGDLAGLDLRADMVVLSGCRTAGGVMIEGEGIQGLTAPLLAAGARSVVATAWRIPDRATVPFVEALYQGLARGLPVGDALRAAKLDAIRRRDPPRVWAAFVAVGDPMVRVALRKPRPGRLGALLVVGVLAAGLVFVVARRRLLGAT
jgi:tetratricopeptide (TPR) repeat protein